MSDTVEQGSLGGLFAAAHAIVDELHGVSMARDSDDALLDGLRELERLRRRLDSVDYVLINEAGRRGLPGTHGARTTGRWLRHLLRLHPCDANARAAAAEAAGPRTALTGEPLDPIYPHVAAGQAAGAVSQRQARLIEKTVDELPDDIAALHGGAIEADLTRYAAGFDPQQLAVLARRMVDHVHPDGTRPEADAAQRRRNLHLVTRRDGTGRLEGDVTAETTERLLTYFDCAAAPRPAVDGIKDDRSLGQRQHDALLDLLETAVRAGDVPSNNGVSATVVITMTREQYETGGGLARTGHGAHVPAGDALRWGGGDTQVLGAVLDSMHAVTHYSHTHRIFTEHQRRVIAARDGGCTFPGCPEPPGRCQVDHIVRYEHGGPTSIDNGALECRYHHREHARLGWRPVMTDGIAWWIPPPWIDPGQIPVRNTLHTGPTPPGDEQRRPVGCADDQRKASMPVSFAPSTSVCTSWVPSYV